MRLVTVAHKLFGYTAMIVRVDRDVPTKPLVELKMDHNGQITYLPYYQASLYSPSQSYKRLVTAVHIHQETHMT